MSKILPFEQINRTLDIDKHGRVLCSIENFVKILRFDEFFSDIKFNALTMTPERVNDGESAPWTDTDDSITRAYIEKVYQAIIKKDAIFDAFNIMLREREYHPVKDVIEAVTWDGKERIETLLSKWLKCDDNLYTREVSRLIFAGGINRLYKPGCKFDNVPVLIGTKQGEGKSTFVNWLAIKDEFFNEITEISGQKGMEVVEGAFICEISELFAFTKSKEVEAVKSYITRQSDKYRRPYDKRVTEHPRQCIFIGTTNRETFLTDKTGNRRFLPVVVNSSGYDLFDSQDEIKDDILQCWAEAFHKFKGGQMPACPDKKLLKIIAEHQNGAVEDDYREGLIRKYLENCDEICIIELWEKALKNDYAKPDKKDSNEISEIVSRIEGWEKGGTKRTDYGVQKVWVKSLPFGTGALENLPRDL